jgi:phosphopantetheinyl transferase
VTVRSMILQSTKAGTSATVYYATVRWIKGQYGLKAALASRLVATVEPQAWRQPPDRLITTDRYGCPRFLMANNPPLALSFSYAVDQLWAAVSRTDSVGIDVETPLSFTGPYPFTRVFLEDEFHIASPFCHSRQDAAALLWSCKEAAMKCKGTGFRFIDPRDVQILSCLQVGRDLQVTTATPQQIEVTVRKERHLWLALAVSSNQPSDYPCALH